MSDARGAWNTDLHKRSESEIADLAPYVSQSAVDAVRDAFRGIVLENQEHSEVLDELLPQLKEEPSMRSQSLDWLDVELSRLSDDAIIEFVGRLKRKRGQGLQLDRETGASEPEGARPPVEPATAPRGRLTLVAAAAVAMVCLLATSYGWATASRDYRAEALKSAEIQAEKAAIFSKIERLHSTAAKIAWAQNLLLNDDLDDPELKLRQVNARLNVLAEAVNNLFDFTLGQIGE